MTDAVLDHSRQSMEQGSKSFAAAARLFPAAIRDDAWMFYAWCRHCDDVVDGQDVLAVRQAAGEAIARARQDGTPTLLEIRTYRFMGHSMSDAVSGTYRTKEELEQYLKRDPIALHRQRMEDAGEITAADIAAMDDQIKQLVQDSIDFAEASPELPLEALLEDVLVETAS